MKYRRKKIWLGATYYVWCRLYDNVEDLRQAWTKTLGNREYIYNLAGFHEPITRISYNNGKEVVIPQTGVVHLAVRKSTPGVVSHEFGHAALWAFEFSKDKIQYPLVINSMDHEEDILHMQTYAVDQFYKWIKNDRRNPKSLLRPR